MHSFFSLIIERNPDEPAASIIHYIINLAYYIFIGDIECDPLAAFYELYCIFFAHIFCIANSLEKRAVFRWPPIFSRGRTVFGYFRP